MTFKTCTYLFQFNYKTYTQFVQLSNKLLAKLKKNKHLIQIKSKLLNEINLL